jgi:hypothetical protein
MFAEKFITHYFTFSGPQNDNDDLHHCSTIIEEQQEAQSPISVRSRGRSNSFKTARNLTVGE